MPMTQDAKPKAKPFAGKLILMGILAFGIALFFLFDLGNYFTLDALQSNKDALQAHAQNHYLLTASVFILVYCLQTALSLPGAGIMTLAGGFLFGTWMGALFANIGATSGAALAFLAARYLFREPIERRFGKQLEDIQQGFARNGFNYLLTLRLIPLFPFFLVNLAAGLTRIRLSTYFFATAIGIVPGSLVFSNAGKQLGTIASLKDIASPGVLGASVLLGLLGLAPILFQKIKSARANRLAQNKEIPTKP